MLIHIYVFHYHQKRHYMNYMLKLVRIFWPIYNYIINQTDNFDYQTN